ncbi:hypothetical protein D3C72_659060 [compost metagenome]
MKPQLGQHGRQPRPEQTPPAQIGLDRRPGGGHGHAPHVAGALGLESTLASLLPFGLPRPLRVRLDGLPGRISLTRQPRRRIPQRLAALRMQGVLQVDDVAALFAAETEPDLGRQFHRERTRGLLALAAPTVGQGAFPPPRDAAAIQLHARDDLDIGPLQGGVENGIALAH